MGKVHPAPPYTYEARPPILKGEETCNSYLADTICGLIDHLEEQDIGSDRVRIHEIYQDQECPIDVGLCVDRQRHGCTAP